LNRKISIEKIKNFKEEKNIEFSTNLSEIFKGVDESPIPSPKNYSNVDVIEEIFRVKSPSITDL